LSLLLIAERRLLKAIVDSSPDTALAVFYEKEEMNKYGVSVETFTKNIMNEALVNRNSFLCKPRS